MNLLEIVLIIIGIVIIIVSCFLVDRSNNQKNSSNHNKLSLVQNFTEDEIKLIRNKTNELISSMSEEALNQADDILRKLSNEKIIAVSEFSDQILEKINRNHEEVVFLYNMLNDKEKELKSVVREIDSTKKNAQEIIKNRKDDLNKTRSSKNTSMPEAVLKNEEKVNTKKQPEKEISDTEPLDEIVTNNYAQILSLYSKGKSVVEISKQLGLGQGEVKLVIELYRKKVN